MRKVATIDLKNCHFLVVFLACAFGLKVETSEFRLSMLLCFSKRIFVPENTTYDATPLHVVRNDLTNGQYVFTDGELPSLTDGELPYLAFGGLFEGCLPLLSLITRGRSCPKLYT